MPGHYIKCVVDAPFPLVYEDLVREFGNIYSKKFSDKQEAVILGEQYFFRVRNDVAVAIILESIDAKKTGVEIISSAGAIRRITYNVHKAFASKVIKYLDRRFKARVEGEISYFGKEHAEAYRKGWLNARKRSP